MVINCYRNCIRSNRYHAHSIEVITLQTICQTSQHKHKQIVPYLVVVRKHTQFTEISLGGTVERVSGTPTARFAGGSPTSGGASLDNASLSAESESGELMPLPSSSPSPSFSLSRIFWCVRMCLFRWSLLMKRLLHSMHTKRFSPVWVLRCLCNSSERVKRFPQNSQLQTKGRSPVCQRKCARR